VNSKFCRNSLKHMA